MEEKNNYRDLLGYLEYFIGIADTIAKDPSGANPVGAKYVSHYPIYTDAFNAFTDAVYTSDILLQDYVAHLDIEFPDKKWELVDIEKADMRTLREMLTKCVRAERFGDGRWAWFTKEGYFLTILRRLSELIE